MKKLVAVALALVAPSLLLNAWVGAQDTEPVKKMAKAQRAAAHLHGRSGSKVTGVVHFVQRGKIVEITGEIKGLAPGKHAFHIHEFGDCSDPKAISAGSHFNPEKKKHGGPHGEERHVGDLGNIEADEGGKAVINIKDKVISLSGKHSIVGRSVIVHRDADDLKTDPTGNAGDRIACGVIGFTKE
jgi:Cu-Zn family superoxide dismutase